MRKKRRQLERLDREAERKERALRRLSKLDRDLAKAAANLMKDLGLSAEEEIIGFLYLGTREGARKSLPALNTEDFVADW